MTPVEDPKELHRLSVQDRTSEALASESPLVFFLASVGDNIPAWPSRARDRELDKLWRTEPILAGAVYSMCAKVAALDFKLRGPRKSVTHWRRVLMMADLGAGWMSFVMKVTQDNLTQDNGGFVEFIRPRNATPRTPIVGLAHLDSQRCQRTGDLETPVIYTDRRNRKHELKWYEVFPLTDMPSPREDKRGYGYSAISRILRAAQTLRDIGIYKRQKLSGKRVPGILVLQGVREGRVKEALESAKREQIEEGQTVYTSPIILASQDPGQAVAAELIELAGLPDGYDEDTTLKWYITTLAMGFGTDYTEFAPMPGGGFGAATQATEMAARARGKGPGVLIQQLEYMLNFFVLPPTTEFQFASTDPVAEQERIQLRLLRARERALRLNAQELTPAQALQLAVDEGDAPESFLQEMEESEEEIDLLVRSMSDLQDSWEKVERLARKAGIRDG